MGERIIKPEHNIFKVYRKVNLVNPYLFSKPFQSTWRTSNISTGSSTSTQIKLPLVSTGTYNFNVDWGDGTSSSITTWNVGTTHTYSVSGDYTIKITGTCVGWVFGNTGDRLKILSVQTWGKLRLGVAQGSYFNGCANLNLSGVTDILDLTGTTQLTGLFTGCTAITTIGRINEWDLIGVNRLDNVFKSCSNFNQDIGNWNVSNVVSMTSLFEAASKFNNGGNPSIGNWVTTSLTALNFTFSIAVDFNQPLNWNMSNVGNFSNTFNGASKFNNGLASGVSGVMSWTLNTTSSVAMNNMFLSCIAFNQDISSWNTSRVISTNSMFAGATNFNNGSASGIAGNMLWNMSNVTTTLGMFQSCTAFNQNLGILNLSSCTTLQSMFNGATKFNNGGSNSIKDWTIRTAGTVNMATMFANTTIFNQPLDNWNTSTVTTMNQMFIGSGFNQNIGNWVISNVANFSDFMASKTPATFSSANLDAIYNGWSTRPVIAGISIKFNTAKYTAASSAGRLILTSAPNNWVITDGGI